MFMDDLTDEERGLVKAIGTPRQMNKGALLIEEGMLGSSFYLIIAGSVVVRKRLRGQEFKELVRLGPGDLAGEVGFLGVELRTASVVALSYCDVLEFERSVFEDLLRAHPVIGLKLYRSMARELATRLASSDEELTDTLIWALDRTRHAASDDQAVPPRPGTAPSLAPPGLLPNKDKPPGTGRTFLP